MGSNLNSRCISLSTTMLISIIILISKNTIYLRFMYFSFSFYLFILLLFYLIKKENIPSCFFIGTIMTFILLYFTNALAFLPETRSTSAFKLFGLNIHHINYGIMGFLITLWADKKPNSFEKLLNKITFNKMQNLIKLFTNKNLLSFGYGVASILIGSQIPELLIYKTPFW